MSDPCVLLSWDTNHFGINIARYQHSCVTENQAEYAISWCAERDIRCLYYLCPVDDHHSIEIAESYGFRLADIRLDYIRADSADHTVAQSDSTRFCNPTDLPVLQKLARCSFTDSRFYQDPNFTREKVNSLYAIWVAKSLEKDHVIGSFQDNLLAGFITCETQEQIGKIGLIAVSPERHGQGIGSSLVSVALDYFSNNGVKNVEVTTQARNIAAQRLYQKFGFRTQNVGIWYHRWFV